MKKRAILIVGLALAIATAGLVYAHWTDTLRVDATVNTGSVNMMFQSYGTDDDGIATNDLSGTDNNGAIQLFDAWGTASSADPANMYRCTGQNCAYLNGGARYDKDVAKCTVSASPDSKGLTATITNAYPSYHCSIFSQLSNEGTVPVKATAFRLTTPAGGTLMYAGTEYVEAAAGTTAWCNETAHAGRCPMGIFVGGVPVITFDFANGTACGNQLDPFASGQDMDAQAYWFHVEQAAAMNASYTFHWEQDFVNWNEFAPSMCTVTINGVTYP
jgi:hypothetical protein